MSSVLSCFKTMYQSRFVVATTILAATFYYLLIEYVISLNAVNGFTFITTPPVLIYLLVLSGAVLLTISIQSIRFSVSRIRSESEGVLSFLTMLVGGLIASCNCEVPVLASMLYLFAFSATTVSAFVSFIGSNQVAIFLVLIALNAGFSYYHLRKLSAVHCNKRKP